MAKKKADNKKGWDDDKWAKYVLERSDYLWAQEEDYRTAVDEWLKAWRLEIDDLSDDDQDEGKAIVISNDPYNIVKLLERLLGGQVRYDVVPTDDSDETQKVAEKREVWLPGYWNRLSMETGKNVRREAIWWAAVAGRICLDTRWVKEVLPEYYQDKRLPVLTRALDPRAVLIQESEFGWPLYGIHRYKTKAYKIRERWGDDDITEKKWDNDQDVTVHDFWDETWNVVVCEDKVIRKVKHEYPRIPFVYAYADPTPLDEAEYKGLSILHPVLKLWQKKSAIWSLIATGIKWYFWPALLHEVADGGQITSDLDITPGKTIPLHAGEKITPLTIDPNVPLAEIMHTAISGAIQDATFPKTLYGQEPGVALAGFALANLASSARGRTGPFREPMEWALAQTCELLLDLIQSREDSGGVDVWAEKKNAEGRMIFNLKDAKLEDHMPIKVTIIEELPRDEQQYAVLGLQEVEAGALSLQTYREGSTRIEHAELEEKRVLREQMMEDENFRKQMIAEALMATTGEEMPGEEDTDQSMVGVEGMERGPLGGGPPPMAQPPQGMVPQGGAGPVGSPAPGGLPPGAGAPGGQPPIPPELMALIEQGIQMGIPPEQIVQMLQQGGGQPQGPLGMMPPGMGAPPQMMSPMPMPQPPPGVPPQLYPGAPPVGAPGVPGVGIPPPLPGMIRR